MTALLPPGARRIAVCLLILCPIVVGAADAVVVMAPGAQQLANAIDQAVMRAAGQDQYPLSLAAALGEKVEVAGLTVVLVGLCLAVGKLNGAALAAIAIPAAPVITEYVLKPLFARPDADGSFPSGHTTAAFAMATVVSVLLVAPGTRVTGRWRLTIALAALLAAAAVMVAVVGLGMHTVTDAAGGAAVGVGVALSVALLLDLPVAQRLLSVAAERICALARRLRDGPSSTTGPAG